MACSSEAKHPSTSRVFTCREFTVHSVMRLFFLTQQRCHRPLRPSPSTGQGSHSSSCIGPGSVQTRHQNTVGTAAWEGQIPDAQSFNCSTIDVCKSASIPHTLCLYLYLNLSMATDRCVGDCLWQVQVLWSFSGSRSTSCRKMQLQSSSLRASRTPTFSSLARLKVLFPHWSRAQRQGEGRGGVTHSDT